MLVFVHIRKTAGTTMRRILYRQYGRQHTRLVRNYFVDPQRSLEMARTMAGNPPAGVVVTHGHMLFWPESGVSWPAGSQFVTLMRDPVERTISHYYWLGSKSARFKLTLEEALAGGAIHDNLQTRVLAATMPPIGRLTQEDLERAIDRLDRFAVVGLSERFDDSLVLMTRALGWRRMLYRSENVTPGRPPRATLSPEELELVKQHNELDSALYQVAVERFEREVAREGEAFQLELATLREAQARFAAGMVEPEPLAPIASPNGSTPLDLEALLVDAGANLLVRDAVSEGLEPGAGLAPVREPVVASETDEWPKNRAAALERAAGTALKRVERLEKRIAALQAGGEPESTTEIDALRRDVERAKGRIAGFERRRAKLDKGHVPARVKKKRA